MSKKKKRSKKPQEPAVNPYANMSPARQKLHRRADDISRQFARYDKTINRVLLAIFAVIVVLWAVKVLAGDTARYLIVAIMGMALAVNGLSGYRNSKWAGFFLMVFGTLLFLGNLFMLTL